MEIEIYQIPKKMQNYLIRDIVKIEYFFFFEFIVIFLQVIFF